MIAAGDGPHPPSRWVAAVQYVGRVAAEAILPRKCRACGAHWTVAADERPASWGNTPESVLCDIFQKVAEPYLCPACISGFEPLALPLCTRCGAMFASRVGEDHLCGDCIHHPADYRWARSAGIYSGGLMALIHHLKYRACLVLRYPLATLLQTVYTQRWPDGEVDMVLPIPLHIRRWRQRGFNQAQLLVDAWAKSGGGEKSGRPQFPTARRILVRSKATPPQTGFGKRARRQNIRGAFSVVAPGAVKGSHILLVDDVYTTGATANEAARVLKRNGAAYVDILTVARTMPLGRSQRLSKMTGTGSAYE